MIRLQSISKRLDNPPRMGDRMSNIYAFSAKAKDQGRRIYVSSAKAKARERKTHLFSGKIKNHRTPIDPDLNIDLDLNAEVDPERGELS